METANKNRLDVNELAKAIVDRATGAIAPPDDGKDPAAVSLGRRGGLKGGPARASKLSKKRRAEIPKKAAKTRWKKHKKAEREPA